MTGSHQKWAEGFRQHSRHTIDLYGLPGRFWKWRMHGGAISLAQKVIDAKKEYDVFLCTDFLNLALFKSLVAPHYPDAKFYLYFHENQIAYPWSPDDQDIALKRDRHYGFINYTSALIADKIFFNSDFHRKIFLSALPHFLGQFPDKKGLANIPIIQEKSQTLPLAIDLPPLNPKIAKIPRSILWNHRREYDKNPKDFFQILKNIQDKGISFQLIVLGEQNQKYPKIFDWAKDQFSQEIIHFGYAASKSDYWAFLQKAAILPVTSNQDFFGISVVEAMHADVYPLLPNRLAYPDHIPPNNHPAHLYETLEELEIKLIQLLSEKELFKSIAPWVEKYSWENSIESYDSAMSH